MNRREKLTPFLCILLFIYSPFVSAKEFHLSYDQNGNLIQDNKLYYEYNSLNQLIKVREDKADGKIIAEFYYDDTGARIKKIEYPEQGTPINTYYIDRNFVRVIASSKTHDTVYYHDSTGLVGEKESDGKKYFYHPNHLGSTHIVSDLQGNVVEETEYLPYGEILSGGQSRYTFTGKEKDRETGLYYYDARYYSPSLRHFTQPDTIIQDVYDPQSLNRYAYVRNNPVNYTDPSGHVPIPIATGSIGGIIGGSWGAIHSTYTQLKTTGEVDTRQVGKAILTGSVSGFVIGATFGLATPYIGQAANTGGLKAALPLAGIAGGTARVAGSQATIATSNLLSGQKFSSGLGNTKQMGGDFLGGTAGAMATYGVSSALLSTDNTCKSSSYTFSTPSQLTQDLGVQPVPTGANSMKWIPSDNIRIFYHEGHNIPPGGVYTAYEQGPHFSVSILSDDGTWKSVINPNNPNPFGRYNYIPGETTP